MTTASHPSGRIEVRPDERLLLVDGEPARLGARAFDLLLVLVEHRDRVVSKNELLETVWPGLVVEENNLQVHISSLRKALGSQAIATIPGRGYRFTAPLDGVSLPQLGVARAASVTSRERIADGDVRDLSNLPAEHPPLVGREAELSALRALIESHRLVTVVGPGGIGKTSLAQALGHQLRGSMDGGVWLVELAPLAEDALLAPTVAGALQLSLGTGTPMEALVRALSKRRMLLILDNCEHLLDGVAELTELLHGNAPSVVVLATSQEPLKVAREQIYPLGPLALPESGGVDTAREAGAVALFEARARALQPGFRVDESNVEAVVDICRRLDGIALAIELAAARVPVLGVEGLRARLDERFRVLTGGTRRAVRRHQTLRAAMEWSHDLLTEDEQAVFRRLGVFAGSFGLESAQHVAADERIDAWMVLEHLAALVDKSLVLVEAGEEPRYRLLETSRAFAMEKLQQAGESEHVRRRHAEALLAVFEKSREEEFTLMASLRIERYLPDLDNARAALDWTAAAEGESQLHIALAGAVGWMWVRPSVRIEGRQRTRQAIEKIDTSTPPHLEAQLLGSWSPLIFPGASPPEFEADARSLALRRTLGDRQSVFIALCRQATTFACAGRVQESEAALQEAESIIESDWPSALRIRWLTARFFVRSYQENFEDSIAALEEVVRMATAAGDDRTAINASSNMEQAVAALGRLEESAARGRELLARLSLKAIPSSAIERQVATNLAMTLAKLGETDEALALLRRARPLWEEGGSLVGMLDVAGLIAFQRGRAADAARILGRADTHFPEGIVRRQVNERRLRDDLLVSLQESLPHDELARLIKEGEAMRDEDCADLALRE